MSTGYYGLDRPNPNAPERGDGRYWGYATMTSRPLAVVLHTTESLADIDGPDSGAENVAHWFTTNATPASYHTLVDSDSIVRFLPAGLDALEPHTAFHAYGYNSKTLGISFAMRADSWPTVPDWWYSRALNRAVNEVAAWCARWDIPARKITRAQLDAGERGILAHADTSPEDRTDPGAGFPWDTFVRLVAAQLDLGGATITPPAEEDDMTPEQDTLLRQLHFWIGQGYVSGGTVTALDPRFNVISAKLDDIAKRLSALEAGEVPTADEVVLAAARRITEGARP